MKDNMSILLISSGILLLVCLFNVYMNLYNDDRIRALEERAYVQDTIIPQPATKDTIIVIHHFDKSAKAYKVK